MIKAGRNGGAWDGVGGIVSSDAAADPARYAVGYALAGEVLGISGAQTATWNGVTVDAAAVLVRHTLAGDADLNGEVGLNDLVRLANNYGNETGQTWFAGDFDFDGQVGLNDLVMLANAYGSSTAVPDRAAVFAADWAEARDLAATGVTSVPEPGGISVVIGLAVAAMSGRRRRRLRV
jgi:hypothetical protein